MAHKYKKFIVFVYDRFDCSPMGSIQGSFDTLKEAVEFGEIKDRFQDVQIVDRDSWKVIQVVDRNTWEVLKEA